MVDYEEGDMVVTLAKVEKIRAIVGDVKEGMIGVIVETGPSFDKMSVYGVLINEQIYYLFADEFEKLED